MQPIYITLSSSGSSPWKHNGSSTPTHAAFATPVAAIRLTMNALSGAGGKVNRSAYRMFRNCANSAAKPDPGWKFPNPSSAL